MSLVGSLEDLGLGEILQIVSLSGKSGVLWIRSPQGEGRIVFDRGAIRGATLEGGARDLRALLGVSGVVPESELVELEREASAEGASFEEVLVARTSLDAARLDELRERHVESTVLGMFGWRAGEFSFEIRDDAADARDELLLRAGMNAQFLALEGTRLRDERQHEAGGELLDDDPELAEEADESLALPEVVAELEITVLEMLEAGAEAADLVAEPIDLEGPVSIVDEDPTLTGDVAHAAEPPERDAPAEPAPPAALVPSLPACTGAVIVDRDLAVLEWAKNAIAPLGLRTHIFPRSELAIQRIRQYFARGETPLVVLGTETPPDPVSGARDWAEIAARLRAQLPALPFLVMAAPGAAVVPANERAIPNSVATRPPMSVLADERARDKREALADELRDAVARATRRPAIARAVRDDADPIRTLREWSARLRDPHSPVDVLRLALGFAGRLFDRAVVFWVRDGEAQAVSQVGVAASGGPDDEALRSVCVAIEDAAVLRKLLESRAPVRTALDDASDRSFVARLGGPTPREVFLAPIEAGEHVAALLYADNASTGRPLPDAGAVEVMLHEAGLALDRAVLERALEQAERNPGAPTER